MKIYYGQSFGRLDVPSQLPVEASMETTLEVFRLLDKKSGFLGIYLNSSFVLQFMPQSRGGIRIELLDTSIPSLDFCVLDNSFAERLIRAAANGEDVFLLAKSTTVQWTHLDLRTVKNDSLDG